MIKLVKAVTRKLQVQYGLYIIGVVLLAIFHETDVITVGVYAGDAATEYALETFSILITIALVPLSLKLFSVKMEKKIQQVQLQKALVLYQKWSTIRLMILALVTYLNILIYYLTLNNIGGLCALIALTASVFCLPSERRVGEELQLNDNNDNKL